MDEIWDLIGGFLSTFDDTLLTPKDVCISGLHARKDENILRGADCSPELYRTRNTHVRDVLSNIISISCFLLDVSKICRELF